MPVSFIGKWQCQGPISVLHIIAQKLIKYNLYIRVGYISYVRFDSRRTVITVALIMKIIYLTSMRKNMTKIKQTKKFIFLLITMLLVQYIHSFCERLIFIKEKSLTNLFGEIFIFNHVFFFHLQSLNLIPSLRRSR